MWRRGPMYRKKISAHQQGTEAMSKRWTVLMLLVCTVFGASLGVSDAFAQTAPNCPTMRKINVGVSSAPPNVVHTSPYIAKELGLFAKRCIDANIVQFEGGQSATSVTPTAQGSAIRAVHEGPSGRGLKVQQIWGRAPPMP